MAGMHYATNKHNRVLTAAIESIKIQDEELLVPWDAAAGCGRKRRRGRCVRRWSRQSVLRWSYPYGCSSCGWSRSSCKHLLFQWPRHLRSDSTDSSTTLTRSPTSHTSVDRLRRTRSCRCRSAVTTSHRDRRPYRRRRRRRALGWCTGRVTSFLSAHGHMSCYHYAYMASVSGPVALLLFGRRVSERACPTL